MIEIESFDYFASRGLLTLHTADQQYHIKLDQIERWTLTYRGSGRPDRLTIVGSGWRIEGEVADPDGDPDLLDTLDSTLVSGKLPWAMRDDAPPPKMSWVDAMLVITAVVLGVLAAATNSTPLALAAGFPLLVGWYRFEERNNR